METMEQLPDEFKGTIFEELWNKLDYYSLPIEDQVYYERVMKRRADERNILATAEEKGKEEGVKSVAKELLKAGKFSLVDISKCTGLPLEQLEELKKTL
jgi:hypothetical protein